MSEIRKIPGYYYDPIKERYFKILPHQTTNNPSGSFYTNIKVATPIKSKPLVISKPVNIFNCLHQREHR